ncbi:MAG TPA: hypothetical protein VFB62_19255, partial [Polyangiaceae bacterium]|nr:hypothetical protein [Polyangiaceae bacterium]
MRLAMAPATTLLAMLVLAAACVASPPWTGEMETVEQLTRAPGLPADFGPGRVGTRTVVLLVIDGVRPREVFLGVEQERAMRSGMGAQEIVSADRLMPNLHRLLSTRAAALGA